MLNDLEPLSRITLFVLLAIIALFSVLLLWAQVGLLRGRPIRNPDGTSDDWREQKVFFGIACADVFVACPLTFVALALLIVLPRLGFYLMGMVGVHFVWTNTMTTVTSLRFEKPRITLQWLIVFPFGLLVGLAYLAWSLLHFEVIFS